MRARNYHVYNSDQQVIKDLADEYVWLGRHVKVEKEEHGWHLVVLALAPKKPKKRETRDKDEER